MRQLCLEHGHNHSLKVHRVRLLAALSNDLAEQDRILHGQLIDIRASELFLENEHGA